MTDRNSGPTTGESSGITGQSRRQFLKAGVATGIGGALIGVNSVASAAQPQELCNESGNVNPGEYFDILQNRWSMPNAEQCIRVNEDGSYGWDFTAGSGDGGENDINYPEVYAGRRPWGSDTGIPEFELPIEEVEQLEFEVDASVSISGGEWDFAEEFWLLDGAPSENPTITHEIMLVLDWGGGHSHNQMQKRGAWTDKFGNTIDHWAHYPIDWNFHIFRVQGGMQSGAIDLTEVVDYILDNVANTAGKNITGIELGNEYWPYATGETTITEFDVTVNGSTYTSGVDSAPTPTTSETSTPTPTTTTADRPSWPTDPQATDPDGDGLYEDVNGNGKVDFPDVNTLFQNSDSTMAENNAEYYDFTGDGAVDIQDVLALFDMV